MAEPTTLKEILGNRVESVDGSDTVTLKPFKTRSAAIYALRAYHSNFEFSSPNLEQELTKEGDVYKVQLIAQNNALAAKDSSTQTRVFSGFDDAYKIDAAISKVSGLAQKLDMFAGHGIDLVPISPESVAQGIFTSTKEVSLDQAKIIELLDKNNSGEGNVRFTPKITNGISGTLSVVIDPNDDDVKYQMVHKKLIELEEYGPNPGQTKKLREFISAGMELEPVSANWFRSKEKVSQEQYALFEARDKGFMQSLVNLDREGRIELKLDSMPLEDARHISQQLVALKERSDGTNLPDGLPYRFIKAVKSGNVQEVTRLFSSNAEYQSRLANLKDSSGLPVLIRAVANNNIKMVNTLLDMGADVNTVNNRKQTGLHWAAFNGNDKIVELLIDKGANLELLNDSREAPIDVAKRAGKETTVNNLVKHSEQIATKKALEANTAKLAERQAKATLEQARDPGPNSNNTPTLYVQKKDSSPTPPKEDTLYQAIAGTGASLALDFALPSARAITSVIFTLTAPGKNPDEKKSKDTTSNNNESEKKDTKSDHKQSQEMPLKSKDKATKGTDGTPEKEGEASENKSGDSNTNNTTSSWKDMFTGSGSSMLFGALAAILALFVTGGGGIGAMLMTGIVAITAGYVGPQVAKNALDPANRNSSSETTPPEKFLTAKQISKLDKSDNNNNQLDGNEIKKIAGLDGNSNTLSNEDIKKAIGGDDAEAAAKLNKIIADKLGKKQDANGNIDISDLGELSIPLAMIEAAKKESAAPGKK